jgi:uncharacterized protein with HEPN domain
MRHGGQSMLNDPAKHLFDIIKASDLITQFTLTVDRRSYSDDVQIRSAVERQFGILGEALRRLEQSDASLAARISDYRKIIAFRNIVVHGYDVLNDDIVWQVIVEKVPILLAEVRQLLAEIEGSKPTP